MFSVGGNLMTVKRAILGASNVKDLIVIRRTWCKNPKMSTKLNSWGEQFANMFASLVDDEEIVKVDDDHDTDSSGEEMEILL